MKPLRIFAQGFGAGAALVLLFASVTSLWKPDRIGNWLRRDPNQVRARRNLERAEQLARLSPDYLDICRAAGL
jgi:hypothetical protein